MRATNIHTGLREDVVLLPPKRLAKLHAAPDMVGIRADINAAFSPFTKTQRRFFLIFIHNI